MVRLLLAAILAAGCSFDHGRLTGDGGTTNGSADADAFVAPSDAQTCWTVAGINTTVCLTAPLSGSVTFTAPISIDTDTTGAGAMQCQPLAPGSSDVCAIAGLSLTVNGSQTVSAHGSRALVLLAQTIIIDGTIDVASHNNAQDGPASGISAGCLIGSDPSAGGGGQGGSFGGKAGDGGDKTGSTGSGGTAGTLIVPTTLRGGCSGRSGGGNAASSGRGGGAVMLVADSITVNGSGTINASGASGDGAPSGDNGGGGAGSGGMIVLSGSTVMLGSGAEVFANGGHGGGGSSNSNNGGDGVDPATPVSGGTGGIGPDNAGDGGPGYPIATRNGKPGTGSGDGGGGGGGGAGIVKIFASSVNSSGALVSPPPS